MQVNVSGQVYLRKYLSRGRPGRFGRACSTAVFAIVELSIQFEYNGFSSSPSSRVKVNK